MKNIYFYSPCATGATYDYKGQHVFVNTVPLYLNSHLKNFRPDLVNQITWSKIQLLELSVEQIAEQIKLLNIDILCVSVYVWNFHHVMDVVKKIKLLTTSKLTILAGGPSVDPHRDSSFLDRYPDVDYAIFAQGEEAFVTIIDHLVNGTSINSLSKNMSWRNKGKIKVSDFQYIRKSSGSPYIESQEILSAIASDPDYVNYKLFLPYETSRGCPYNCSFCDWTSGLSHKVSHRVNEDWIPELSLLGELGFLNLHISDANFGQHKQDILIAKTMAKLKATKGYKFCVVDTNFSKLKKKESFEILNILLEAGIVTYPKFAVQDTNQSVLDNVDRPDIPWPEHKKLIQHTMSKYPNLSCQIELIRGLPGQTRDTWEQTLIDVKEFNFRAYPWTMLPNSPAGYDANYRQEKQIKTLSVILENYNNQPQEVIVETYSYNKFDYMYFSLLTRIVNTYYGKMSDRKKLFQRIRNSQHLDKTLETMLNAFVNSQPLRDIVFDFMDKLFSEYAIWPKEIKIARQIALAPRPTINAN